jgi:outer membrane protein
VLQAQTALSQAELARIRQAGAIAALRGVLAAAMGLPANTAIDVGELPAEALIHPRLTDSVEALIERALGGRPDLAAARFRAVAARRRADATRAEKWPELTLSGAASRTYWDPSPYADFGNGWAAALLLKVPLFTGFQQVFDLQEDLEVAEQSLTAAEQLEQQVVLEVWTAFVDLETAAARVATSTDLRASAEESERVALARYKEGVGSILDLLAAQASLARARSELISAHADSFLAAAHLARATGNLVPAPAASGAAMESTP